MVQFYSMRNGLTALTTALIYIVSPMRLDALHNTQLTNRETLLNAISWGRRNHEGWPSAVQVEKFDSETWMLKRNSSKSVKKKRFKGLNNRFWIDNKSALQSNTQTIFQTRDLWWTNHLLWSSLAHKMIKNVVWLAKRICSAALNRLQLSDSV